MQPAATPQLGLSLPDPLLFSLLAKPKPKGMGRVVKGATDGRQQGGPESVSQAAPASQFFTLGRNRGGRSSSPTLCPTCCGKPLVRVPDHLPLVSSLRAFCCWSILPRCCSYSASDRKCPTCGRSPFFFLPYSSQSAPIANVLPHPTPLPLTPYFPSVGPRFPVLPSGQPSQTLSRTSVMAAWRTGAEVRRTSAASAPCPLPSAVLAEREPC